MHRYVRFFMATAALTLSASSPAKAPNLNVGQLCNAVSDFLGASKPTAAVRYQYQEFLRAAAGVSENDAREVVRSKLQRYWLANRYKLRCNQLGFSITNGNIVKLAVERDNREALNDFIRRWGFDLNFIDPADGKTVLDYVESELATVGERYPGDSTQAAILQEKRNLLLRFGAKRRSQL